MAESPVFPTGSDAEKGIYRPDQRTARYDGEKGTPIYAEEPIAEEEVLEFGETKELRYVLLLKNAVNNGGLFHIRQGLHQRHIQMIALAGTIGTVRCSNHSYRAIHPELDRDYSLVQERPLQMEGPWEHCECSKLLRLKRMLTPLPAWDTFSWGSW